MELENAGGVASPGTARVAVVQLWSTLTRTPDENRAHALAMLERAARPGLDLVVLPEAVSMLCYPDGRADFTYRDVVDRVPGPMTEAIARIAAGAGVNVVAGLIEDQGPDRPCQNVALVFDRSGSIVGRYEKTHEPEICRHEQAAGIGGALPTFDLDFGRIGIFICWDLLAPEVASILTLSGAQLLCFPHMIALPTRQNFAVTLRARAIDNAVPVAAAGMRDEHNHNGHQDGLYPTCILDAQGEVIAQATEAGPAVVTASVTLGGSHSSEDDWFSRRGREARPGLYARLYAALPDATASDAGEVPDLSDSNNPHANETAAARGRST